jgi:hypothetical protein
MATAKKKGVSSVDRRELAARLFVNLYGAGNGRTAEHWTQEAFNAAGMFLQTYEASLAAEMEAEEVKAREEAEAALVAESPSAATPGETDVPADDSQASQ